MTQHENQEETHKVRRSPAQTTLTLILQDLTALGALLFVTGWSYGRAYYGAFGIGLNQLEIPVTSYLAWVQPLILEAPFRLLVVPALVYSIRWWLPPLLLWLSASKGASRLRICWEYLYHRVVDPHVSFLLMLLFLFIYAPFAVKSIADKHADRDASQGTTSLPRVLLQLKTPQGEDRTFLDRLRRENISDVSYMFLGRHRQMSYLVPYRGWTGMNEVRVLVLPDALVGSIRVLEGEK